DYKAKAAKMTLSERKEMEGKIKAKKLEAQSFLEKTNAELLEKNRAMTQQRLKEISDVIQAYAKENNFDVIFDKKNLPYFSSTIDITDAIITKLNKK
ncbi:MAG: OmpH family outer membrane protein, partial [Candidatus Ratteibacteria bacterium]